MPRLILDEIDLKILNLLGRNGRLPYRNIAHTIGLTTKSVKARVDKMISGNVIERFITLVNPSILSYNSICTFAIRNDGLSNDITDRIKLVGDIQYQFQVLGGAVGFSIAVKEESEEKIKLLLKSLQRVILGATVQRNINPNIPKRFTSTDYQIIKQLVLNPRMEITDIGKAISISPKTIRRRLDRILQYRLLEFTILPNPYAMKGQIVFFLEVKIDRMQDGSIFGRIFTELHDNLILSLMVLDHISNIGLILASEDVLKIESIRSRVNSLFGVKEANIFFPIRIECNREMVVKAIEQRVAKMKKSHYHDNNKVTPANYAY
jgi:DNA-binding Lrp family transcriptional regulator